MSSKKKASPPKQKDTIPPPSRNPSAPAPAPAEVAPAPPAKVEPPPPPPVITQSEAPEEMKENRASFELLNMALQVFKINFLKSVPHNCMRTFAHHRIGEKYDTGIIFDDLERLNLGKHKELVADIEAFEVMVMEEYDRWLAAKKRNG